MEQNPEKTGAPPPTVVQAQVVAVDGVAVTGPPPTQVVGVPYGGYDTSDQPARMPSKMDQVRDFMNREWGRVGPITVTTRRLFMLGGFFVFLLILIIQVTGVLGSGNGNGSGGGGGGSFIAGTRVKLENGTWQCIEEIRIGDRLAIGGRVTARMEFESDMDDLFLYPLNGSFGEVAPSHIPGESAIIVAGGHAVLENRRWLRVRSSAQARAIASDHFQKLLTAGNDAVRVFDLDVERHRIVVRPGVAPKRLSSVPCKPLTLSDNSSVVFADFSEVDVGHEAVRDFEAELLNALQKSQLDTIEL